MYIKNKLTKFLFGNGWKVLGPEAKLVLSVPEADMAVFIHDQVAQVVEGEWLPCDVTSLVNGGPAEIRLYLVKT